MQRAKILKLCAGVGDVLDVGAPFVEIRVDLSDAIQHDCPPVSTYRIAVRDRVWLRRVWVNVGDEAVVDAPIALFSTTVDEPLLGEPVRLVRITTAAIVAQPDWWSETGDG